MRASQRSGRTLFLLYVCAIYVAVLAALPLMSTVAMMRSVTAPHAQR